MFSFIKKIQELLSKLKKNKGLLFTTLTIVSISGIGLFMFLIMNMTSNIRKDVYSSISDSNSKSIEAVMKNKKTLYTQIINTIKTDENIINDIKLNNKSNLEDYEKTYNKALSTNRKYPILIKFFPIIDAQTINRDTITNILKSKSEVFGIETQSNGVYLTDIQPVIENGDFIGLIEVKQTIHSLQEDYLNRDTHFAFLMDKKMLVKLSLKAKSGTFKDVKDKFIIKTGFYKSTFYSKIIDIDPEEFKVSMKNKYDSDDKFFRSYKKVTDINGVEIGLYVFGQNAQNNSGFVKLVDNMIKSVTYVSLGLVVSILLFMF